MSRFLRSSWRAYVVLGLFFAIAVSYPIVDRLKNGSRGEAYHQRLLSEFETIRPPSAAVMVKKTDSYSPWRPHQAMVGATYKTTVPYPAVRQIYDQQLRANGWRPLDARAVTDWGRNLGGQVAQYCKAALTASLQYAGSQADYGWTFAFDLSWGLGVPKCG